MGNADVLVLVDVVSCGTALTAPDRRNVTAKRVKTRLAFEEDMLDIVQVPGIEVVVRDGSRKARAKSYAWPSKPF